MKACTFCCTELNQVGVKKGDVTLIEDISLHLHCNEITAIIGPNGAGKTTLFKTLLGEEPHTGSIRYVTHEGGEEHFSPTIGYVPQHLNFDRSTPISVLDLFASCSGRTPAWRRRGKAFRQQVLDILEEAKMGYALDRKIGALSGGELQRVLLALALTPTPDILLLDEPISGVDLEGTQRFYEMVRDLRSRYHMAIVLITHDLPLLPEICDRAILLKKRVLCMGKPEVVLEHEATRELFFCGQQLERR
ncbi:MAG: metal ABC transporter ATP-binding protein [Cellulosilyticaceae bacterium]